MAWFVRALADILVVKEAAGAASVLRSCPAREDIGFCFAGCWRECGIDAGAGWAV